MTFDSGAILSCFRQDLTVEEIEKIRSSMPNFQKNFANKILNLSMILDF